MDSQPEKKAPAAEAAGPDGKADGKAANGGATGAIEAKVGRREGLDMPQIVLLVETPNKKVVAVEATTTDGVMDIKQFLLETPESCYFTCYQLVHEGRAINPYAELSEYPEISEGAEHQVKMVPSFYDERTARAHVRRLREIIVDPPARIIKQLNPYISEEDPLEAKIAQLKQQRGGGGKRHDAKKSGAGKKGGKKGAKVAEPVDRLENEEFLDTKASLDLSLYHKIQKKEKVLPLVHNINYSAWNPPPGNRKLRGDLLYIQVTTLEGNVLHITASVTGFYLNSSTRDKFNPAPSTTDYRSHTLVDLLKAASHRFSSNFSQIMNRRMTKHPYEMMPGPYEVPEWAAVATPHGYDWNRAEDSLLATHGMESGRGVLRDWNEEYQSCHEMPRRTLQERMMFTRTKYRVYLDFREAAVKGACAVVNGNIPPINPMDEERALVYLYNKIFFSITVDARDGHLKQLVGDKVTFTNAGHDLAGIAAFERCNIPKLHTLATTIVDYKGHRVLAQSIIPGVFHGDQSTTHVYGLMDAKDSIKCEPSMHRLMQSAAARLHIREHVVSDPKTGKPVRLASGVETKGIIGSDKRHYVLDLTRVFPRDANFPDYKKTPDALLRPELLQRFCGWKGWQICVAIDKKKREEEAKKKAGSDGKDAKEAADKAASAGAAGAAAAGAAAAGGASPPEDAKAKPAENGKQGGPGATAQPPRISERMLLAATTSIRFNPDALRGVATPDEKTKARDELEIKEASAFLLRKVIPKMVINGFRQLGDSPTDTLSLTAAMHKNGVNMRYLGQVMNLANKVRMPHIARLCTNEMLARAAKTVLNALLRDAKPDAMRAQDTWFLAPIITKFLNSFLGSDGCGQGVEKDKLEAAEKVIVEIAKLREAGKLKEAAAATGGAAPVTSRPKLMPTGGRRKNKRRRKKQKRSDAIEIRLENGSRAPTSPLDPVNVWVAVRAKVVEKFKVQLPLQGLALTPRRKLCLLRSLCKKVGIQLAARAYNFSSKSDIFSVNDVLNLYPVVKSLPLRSADADMFIQQGKRFLGLNQWHLAYAKFRDALTVLHQTFGPMHEQSGLCYSLNALTCYHARDLLQAVELQQKALLVYQRVLGKDDPKTAFSHVTMALFLHSIGQTRHALTHMKRAVFLLELMCGPNTPEVAGAHVNLAMLYQDARQGSKTVQHLNEARKRYIRLFGEQSTNVALVEHSIAVAASLVGDFRKAIEIEKRAKSVYLAALGDQHPRVRECSRWIAWYSKNAVQMAKSSGKKLDKSFGFAPLPKELSPFVWVPLQRLVKQRLTQDQIMRIVAMHKKQAEIALAKRAAADAKTGKASTASPAKAAKTAPAAAAAADGKATTAA